jgi:hypothetical protein
MNERRPAHSAKDRGAETGRLVCRRPGHACLILGWWSRPVGAAHEEMTRRGPAAQRSSSAVLRLLSGCRRQLLRAVSGPAAALAGLLRRSDGRSPPGCMPDHALIGSVLDEIGDDVSCRRRTKTTTGVLRASPRPWPISAIHYTGSPAAPQLPGDLPLGQ